MSVTGLRFRLTEELAGEIVDDLKYHLRMACRRGDYAEVMLSRDSKEAAPEGGTRRFEPGPERVIRITLTEPTP